jgi:hypothetical protein
MTRVKVIAAVLVLAVLAVLGDRAAAQQQNTQERTFLTFSSAVEMPGVTLQPGTYVFKLADTPTRNVVQVWDQNEENMIGHWLFVQAERPEVTQETVVMFGETREGATPAVQYWYFPGERIGKEFIYPKDQAERIAARTGADVKIEGGVVEGEGLAGVQAEASTTASAETAQSAPAAAQPSAPAGSLAGNRGVEAEAQVDADAGDARAGVAAQAEVTTPAPQPAVPESQVAANQQPQPADADAADRSVGTTGQAQAQFDELPRTASPLALTGLLGLLSLAGAAGLRARRR